MKIVYDLRWSGCNGIGRFSEEIIKRLDVCIYDENGKPSSPFDPIILSLKLFHKYKNYNLFLSPGYNGPIFSRQRFIISIHDINHVDRSENSSLLKRLYYHIVLRHLTHRAAAILTVSEFSKNRIVKWFNIDPSKVYNIGNGISEVFTPYGNTSNICCSYILSVSNRRAHKNEESLLKAFSLAILSPSTKLVLTGEPSKQLIKLAKNLGITDRVIFSGKLSENDLAALYRGAIMMVFPSLYEGFGLPIIEAFACGTPVITSNVTAMPEIAGDAAILINPLDVDEISSAITRLYESHNIRLLLREKGILRASHYTWDKVANCARDVINNTNLMPRE